MNRQMQHRSWTKFFGVVLVIALLLSACAAPAAAPASTANSGEAPSNASDSGRVFKIWHYETEDSAMSIAWEDALADFQAMHPDVTIQFERKTFEQMVETSRMILNTNDVPDVMEINKGNATTGLYAREGLLTNLDEVAAERGWDTIMPPSVQTTSRYNEKGIMGEGPIYGVTNYGEYVMVYYNKDIFAEQGLEVPTTYEEFNAVADALVAAGIQPLVMGAASRWPQSHNWQELLLYEADRQLVNDFQFLTGDIDFEGPAWQFAAEQFAAQVEKGYYGENSNGLLNDDAQAAFVQGQSAMWLTGSWAFGGLSTQITDYDWGIFLMPGKDLTTGSGGNLWVVPTNAVNKDLAYDFIDLTLQPKSQTIMANEGGIPINADLDQIADEGIKELNANFAAIVERDGLSFYPDWPVPGYMDVIGAGLQEIIDGTMTPAEFNATLAAPYNEYKDSLE